MNVSVLVCTYGDRVWSDRAQEAAKSAQDADETIVLHEDDATLAEVRNHAAAAAASDWLCFLDADDELAPGYLAAMHSTFERLQIGDVQTESGPRPSRNAQLAPLCLLVPAVEYRHPSWVRIAGGPPRIPDWDRLLIDLNCAVIGTLVRRDLFHVVGGFREWQMYEDWDIWLRCVRAGARLIPVPSAVYCACVSPASRNQQDHATRASTYAAIRAEHADVEPGWWRTAKVRT